MSKTGPLTFQPSLRVPQPSGVPGWLLLSHDEERARALFVDAKGKQEELALCIDERICCDTIFRVVKLSPHVFAVQDLWVLNGDHVHPRSTYPQRSEWIRELLVFFHSPDLVALVSLSELPVGTIIRGTEAYDDMPGSLGVFLPDKE